MSIVSLLNTMASLFLAMAAGFAAAKLGIIDGAFNRKLTKLLITLIHPCMVLSTVLNTEHILSNLQVFQLLGAAACCYAVLIPLSWLVVKLLRTPREDAGTYRFLIIFSNMGFMGFPIVQALYGENATFYVTIFVLLFQLVVYTYGVHLLSEPGKPFRPHFKILLRPMVITALVSLGIYLLDLRVPAMAAQSIKYVGSVSTPVSMMIIGCSLAEVPLRSAFASPRLYAVLAVKMAVIPLLAHFVLCSIMGESLLLGITIVILSMPVASNATILSLAYGGNQELASTGVFLSTLLSIFSVPAIMWLLFGR